MKTNAENNYNMENIYYVNGFSMDIVYVSEVMIAIDKNFSTIVFLARAHLWWKCLNCEDKQWKKEKKKETLHNNNNQNEAAT